MLDISLKQMRYAVEIAQCGSINQAAQNLYVTQSSLSKAMKELENVLGYAVFQRTPAGTAVTEEGQSFLELAHQIIRLYSFNDYEKGIYYNVAPISGGRPNGVVAGEARGEFCVAGIPENADFPVIQARLDSMADQVTVEGCRVQVTYRTLFPAMERNAANHSAYLRAAEAAELLGWEPEEIADPAATDGAYLSTYGVPTVDALSAIAEQIHTTEERVRIPSIRDRTALCAAMLGLLG